VHRSGDIPREYVEAATRRVLDSQRMLEVLMREGSSPLSRPMESGDWSGAATNETPFASN
jgi:hypothetical protein